jgi:hypothetical protein
VNSHLHIRGRNCDRAVERSPALEPLDQKAALLFRNPFHPKMQVHGVEQCHVGPHWSGAIKVALDIHCDSAQREGLRLGQHLHEFNSAARDTRKKQFGRSDGLAGAAVLNRPVEFKQVGFSDASILRVSRNARTKNPLVLAAEVRAIR